MKKSRVSKNIEDIRSPRAKKANETKVTMGENHKARVFHRGMEGNQMTHIQNFQNATDPGRARIPRAAKKPSSKPNSMSAPGFRGNNAGVKFEKKKAIPIEVTVTPGKWKQNMKSLSDTFKNSSIGKKK